MRKGVNTKHIHSHMASYSHWRTKNYCPFQQNTICFLNRRRRQDGQATLRHHANNAVLLETKILSVKLWRKMPHLTRKMLIFFPENSSWDGHLEPCPIQFLHPGCLSLASFQTFAVNKKGVQWERLRSSSDYIMGCKCALQHPMD